MGDFEAIEARIALILSGSGYRAMLFHLGALWRLNDLGLLSNIELISSVSGGSIVAATLGARWNLLQLQNGHATNFESCIVEPLRNLASVGIDRTRGITGLLTKSFVSQRQSTRYRDLTNYKSLADLPDRPSFVFRSSSLQTGGAWEFCKAYVDSQIGRIVGPKLDLATVLSASVAMPPLSPVVLDVHSVGTWSSPPPEQFADPGFSTHAVLCDGALCDDVDVTALSTYRTVLVSDAGAEFAPSARPRVHWLRGNPGTFDMAAVQCYRRRRGTMLTAFSAQHREDGAYWDISGKVSRKAEDSLVCDDEVVAQLAALPTALTALRESEQKSLIDWGFARCDNAVRVSVERCRLADPPDASPYGTFYRRRPLAAAGAA